MKFFQNLPKTLFQSTAGIFEISDFFTYLDVEAALVSEGNVSIDNKTTLLEAAHNIYGDANSFWAFVAANNIINPFDLLTANTTLYQKTSENKINFLLMPSPSSLTGGMAFPIGSLVLPYTANAGASSEYGSTGNFNLNGPVAVIEQSSFYDGNMIIGNQLGGTGPFISVGAASEQVTILKKNTDGSYSYAGDFYVTNKKQADQRVTTIVQSLDAKTINRETTTANVTIDDLLPASAAIAGTTVSYTAIQQIDQKSKTIKAYVPSELGFVRSSFVTTKYN